MNKISLLLAWVNERTLMWLAKIDSNKSLEHLSAIKLCRRWWLVGDVLVLNVLDTSGAATIFIRLIYMNVNDAAAADQGNRQ